MKRCAFFVHGFNVRDDGKATVDTLKPYFEARGLTPYDFDYGWRGLFGVRLFNDTLAQGLAALAAPGDVAVGHSNGCAIIHAATHHGAPFRHVIYINPALDSDQAPGPQVERFDVWHSPSDTTVKLSSWLPFHQWGAMGAEGYTGTDSRARNFDKQNNYPISSSGHSDVFERTKVRFFGPMIAGQIEDIE